MKIKCEYCGAFFNDTMTECPHCGALNPGVVRTTSTQPLTIEDLAKWYKDRGLPPYETTRFFIGENHQGPRAFGIYKDERTGNFVVYKNKDSGQRAIRYEGTDEAYAVNELFQRLKQEIIEQKNRKVAKAKAGQTRNAASSQHAKPAQTRSATPVSYNSSNRSKKKKGFHLPDPRDFGCLGWIVTIIVGFFVLIFGLYFVVQIWLKISDFPEQGYYKYEDSVYYWIPVSSANENYGYALYDPKDESWSGVIDKKDLAPDLVKNKTAKNYYLGKKWQKKFGCNDFTKTEDYIRISGNSKVKTGYFKHNNNVYYHDADYRYNGWYMFNDDDDTWSPVDTEEIPEDLTYYYQSEDFYYTPDWDSETQLTDFEDTTYYESNHPSGSSSSGSDDDNNSWWDNDDDDSSYDWGSDWDSDGGWDSGGSDWDSDW